MLPDVLDTIAGLSGFVSLVQSNTHYVNIAILFYPKKHYVAICYVAFHDKVSPGIVNWKIETKLPIKMLFINTETELSRWGNN